MAKKTIKYLENGEYHDATVKDVGVIEELKTESKDNLVEAINEIFLGGGKGFSDLQQKVDESTQAAQNAQQAANNLQQKLDEVAQNVGLSDEEVQKIINQAVEDAKRAQAEALQAYKDAQKELDDSMAQFMEEQKAINKELEQAKADIQGDIDQKNAEIEQINAVIESTKSDLTATSARLASVRNDLSNAQMDWGKVRQEITNINGKLDSKMSNTDFDEYKERIERNETEITQTKNELQSKATKQDLDVLTGTVTTQGSDITQLAGKLEGKVSKDTLANDIDDFQVKKANIFTGTREFMGWEFSDKALGRVNDDIYNHSKVAELHNGSNLSITVDGLEVGKTYSVSIFAKVSANSNTSGVKVTVDNGKSYSGLMRTVYTPHDTKVTTNWQRYYATIVASATTMKFVFDRSGMTSDITLYLNRPKLEVGETVYAWEDNAQDIYKRVEHTEAQFDVYNDQISGIVKRQTETDKKIENVRSTFTQRADGIEANSKKYTDDKTTGLAEEFSGKLKATSQELSTEYEKQTNAKIGALSDGGSNLILNSSFLITDNNGNATLENWRDISSKVSLTTISDKGSVKGLDGTWLKSGKATSGNGTGLGARTNYFPVKQGKLVVGVDVVLDAMGRPYNGSISPYILRIEYYDASNNRVNYEAVTLQKLGLTEKDVVRVGLFDNYKYARGVYKTSNDRSDVAKACIVVPETITGYDMYLTNFFAKFSDVNDGTYEVNPLDQQASLIKQRTKIEQDSEKINLLNTQTEKLGNDIKATNTSVNVLKGEVDLKASQSTVNNLTNRVAKNEADIKVFPDKIKSEVSEVSKKVDGVNDKVDGIQVGGTNLLTKTSNDWKTWTGTGWANQTLDNGPIDLEPGTYTFRAEIDNTGNTQRGVHSELFVATENVFLDQIAKSYTQTFVNAGSKGYVTTTFTIDRALTDVRIHPHAAAYSAIPSTVTIKWRREKLEKGNIATDWSPAPEDTDASIESVKTVATQTKDGFDRLTQKTGYNASTGEFSKVTTQINEGIKGVSSEVKSVSNRLDNLSVGGTNLLRKTSNDWKTWTGTGWANDTVDAGSIDLEPGTYTFRAEIDNTGNTQRGVHVEFWVNSEKNFLDQIAKSYTQTFVNAGSKGYVTTTFTIDRALTDVRIHPHAAAYSAIPSTVTIKWRREKLEKGNIATDWSPAPEDTDNKIGILQGQITANANKFNTVYTKTDVDNKINPLNSRTEFLQDNSKFLLRVQESGAATGGVNNLLTNSDTFDGYSENNTNNVDFQKIEDSGLPSVPNQPSITMMGHVWDNYGSVYNKNDGIYLENGETYWFGVYLMTNSNNGAFRDLAIYASWDKGQAIGSANKYFAGEKIDFNKHFGGKTKTWKWNTFKLTGDGTTRYNWRIEPYNHIGGSIWTAGYMLVKSPFPPTGWSPNMTDVQMRLDSGGVTINGNTTIDGTLNAKGMILDDKTGSKLEFTSNGLDISYSRNRNQYFTFSGKGLDFWKYTEAEGVQDYPYHHKPGYARLGNLTAWDGSYNDRTNYTARKNLDLPTNYNGMGLVIDVTGGGDEFSIWQEGTSYRSDSGPIGQGQYWSLFNVNATGFGAARGRGIHHYTSNYFWSDQQRYNWQDDATLLGTIHDNGWKELELLSYRSTMAVKSDPRNSNVWVNGFIFGSPDGGGRLFGYDGNQWIDVVNKRTTRDNEDYTNHFASMHAWEFQAHAFTQTSQLSQKTDIEPLDTKDFMSKLLSIDLYKYRYKTQSSEEKDNYGAIIDDVNEVKKYNLPQEFITTRDKGVNTNNLITGLIATVQEQAKQIENLTFRILEIERRSING